MEDLLTEMGIKRDTGNTEWWQGKDAKGESTNGIILLRRYGVGKRGPLVGGKKAWGSPKKSS